MQHIEFFNADHFENNYHRIPPPAALSHLADFFWETKFDRLWKIHPKGFSDAQFPNIGYTYILISTISKWGKMNGLSKAKAYRIFTLACTQPGSQSIFVDTYAGIEH
jgi:hypothetical protein